MFVESCRGKAPGTLAHYKQVLATTAKHFHATDTTPLLADINGGAIQQLLNDIRERTSSTTANFYHSVLKAFFNHAIANDNLRENPVLKVDGYKTSRPELENQRRPFTKEEIRDVYAAAPTGFWRFAIPFGLYTGLRLGNVVTLRHRDIDLQNKIVNVIDIKSPDPLAIPICSPFLLNVLSELRRKSPKAKPDDYVFPEHAKLYLRKTKSGANNAAVLSSEFRDILVDAGILGKYERKNLGNGRSCKRTASPLSFHSFRHNFVTMLKERGASQMVARELVGHDSDAVNNLYTHTSPDLLRRSLKKLPEVFK